MAVTQLDIDNLNKAIAQGEKIVRIGDKWVEYHSPSALITARNDLQRQLELSNSAPRKKVIMYTQSGRGY